MITHNRKRVGQSSPFFVVLALFNNVRYNIFSIHKNEEM